mmetsp:Transcript_48896/g.98602  ORF Transcript_48896/g.98602 Transcript_48896/m.98602 type:complete len:204 (-) Transcript_48896:348-959(-)
MDPAHGAAAGAGLDEALARPVLPADPALLRPCVLLARGALRGPPGLAGGGLGLRVRRVPAVVLVGLGEGRALLRLWGSGRGGARGPRRAPAARSMSAARAVRGGGVLDGLRRARLSSRGAAVFEGRIRAAGDEELRKELAELGVAPVEGYRRLRELPPPLGGLVEDANRFRISAVDHEGKQAEQDGLHGPCRVPALGVEVRHA